MRTPALAGGGAVAVTTSKIHIERIRVFAAFLCAVVLASSVFFWARSRHHSYIFAFRSPRGFLNGIATDHTGIMFAGTSFRADGAYGPPDRSGRETVRNYAGLTVDATDFSDMLDSNVFGRQIRWKGFRLAWGDANWYTQFRIRALLLPYWFLILVSAPLVIVSARRSLVRWRWKSSGRCTSCGYDLRFSSGVCPECGAADRISPRAASMGGRS